MLLEAREGDVAIVPVDAVPAGLKPTDADLQRYYAANRNRYMVPEQRVLRIARIGPEQVAGVSCDRSGNRRLLQRQPGDLRREGNPQSSARRWCRTRQRANAIAARARGGATLCRRGSARWAKRSGHFARPADPRANLRRSLATGVAAAAFAAPPGAIVGPIQSDLRLASSSRSIRCKPRGRQDARRGARRNRRQAHRRQAQGSDRPTSSPRSRTPSTTAAISPKPRPRPSCRSPRPR